MSQPRALVKFNGGRGTVLCSVCRVMLCQQLSAAQVAQVHSAAGMPPQYCDKHQPVTPTS